jgi:hypothetical protein
LEFNLPEHITFTTMQRYIRSAVSEAKRSFMRHYKVSPEQVAEIKFAGSKWEWAD